MRDGETALEYEMRMEPKRHVRLLIGLFACSVSRRYARRHRSLAAAWRGCARADWMEWLLRQQINRSSGTDVACNDAAARLNEIMNGIAARYGYTNVYGAECRAACDDLRKRHGTPQFVLDGRVVR